MRNFFFIDNWVYSLLPDKLINGKLIDFIRSNKYVTALTSTSLAELYNPMQPNAQSTDRVENAVRFLAKVPCVILEPSAVFAAEIDNNLKPLSKLPINLDLEKMRPPDRADVLRKFLRRDPLFVNQGKDIRTWSDNLLAAKRSWQSEIKEIIENACREGHLHRTKGGNISLSPNSEEIFLLSLDLRHASADRRDLILYRYLYRLKSAQKLPPTAIRVSSLFFLHAYVPKDLANKIRTHGSDIADMYHLSLAPYFSALTVDKNMMRIFDSFRQSRIDLDCQLITRNMLLSELN